MILNQSRYEAAKDNLKELTASIAKFEVLVDGEADRFALQGLDAMKGFASDMQRDINEYLFLKSGKFVSPKSFRPSELPKILIQTRIASCLSQQEPTGASRRSTNGLRSNIEV